MAPLLSWQVRIGHDSQASVSVDAGTSASAEVRRSSTRILNRLHGLLRDVIPSGVPLDLSATKAAALLRTSGPPPPPPPPPPRPAHRPAAHRHPAPRQRRSTSTLTDDHGLRVLLESAANSPTSSTLVGVWAIFYGVNEIFAAFTLREAGKQAERLAG
jgi:hypothetical protein